MFNRFISKSKRILISQQSSVLSAATLIMVMIIASKVLGFVRQRTIFSFFSPEETDIFLAAFELPDIIFEVLVFGVVSAAFIPTFSRYLSKRKENTAWYVASSSLNIILTIFLGASLFIYIFAEPIYGVLTGGFFKSNLGVNGGFSAEKIIQIVAISRLLLLSQFFFVVSSFMTGVLESYKRFLIPALAPLFYNVGIILGTVLLSSRLGLLGPTIGAIFGAFFHLFIQIPAVAHVGFRPRLIWDINHPGVRKMARLAAPRVLELSLLQVRRFVWLFLGSLVAGGFTYLRSADLLQSLPVGVFGLSLAKAALPTLSRQSIFKNKSVFAKTFYSTLNQILFLVIPTSIFLAVLRVPLVRLIFGAERFDWEATVQTGYILSGFVLGTFAYAGSLLVSRAFYALHETRTPVLISTFSVFINALMGFVFVLRFGFGTWGIALSYSIAGIIQFAWLTTLLLKRIEGDFRRLMIPLVQIVGASSMSGVVVFFLLKFFDKSVWVKRLSFLGSVESTQKLPFEKFVLDTRYTGNLVLLSFSVVVIGVVIYLTILVVLRSNEVWAFFGFIKRVINKSVISIPKKEEEQMAPPPTDLPSS